MRNAWWALLAFSIGLVVGLALDSAAPVGAAGPTSFADLIARADAGVAHVAVQLEGDRAPGSRDDAVGAGFVLAPDGWIVTNRHVLRGARRVLVTLPGYEVMEAQVVGSDAVTDVAVLRVPARGLVPLPIGNPRALRKGDWVLAAGSPFHLPRSWSVGIVSGLGRTGVGVNVEGYEDFIQTDAAANVGNSGGPLFNAAGEVVGMVTAVLSRTGRSEGVSMAVPVDVVVQTADRLRRGQPLSRPTLGVIVRETDVRGSGQGGLKITRFQPSSPGRDAGLRAGDALLAVDGVATRTVADLQRVLWAKTAGATVTVVFLRDGQRLQLPVRLR